MKITRKYLLVLICMCGLIATSLGLLTNIAGLFFTPVADDFGIQRGTVSLTLTISNLVYAIGGLIAPYFMKEKRRKLVLIICTALTAGATALMAAAPNIWFMYVCNAIRGLSAGILGVVFATTVINNWFVANVGLATSIVMATSGIAGALFSPIINAVITAGGWRTGYLVVGILMLAFNLPAVLFLPSLKPETKGMTPLGGEREVERKETTENHHASSSDHISIFMFVIVFLFAMFSCAATALPQHFPGIAEAYSLSAAVGALMLSISMIANSGGKIIMGILIDRIGTKKTLLLYAIIVSLGLIALITLHNAAGMYLGAAFVGLSYSMGTVAIVMLTRDTFGNANYGRTYPKITLGGTIGNAVYSSAIGFMYDASGSYLSTLLTTLCFMAFAVIAIVICYSPNQHH